METVVSRIQVEAAARSVPLSIRWNGADAITVDKAVELGGNSMLLSELAALLKSERNPAMST